LHRHPINDRPVRRQRCRERPALRVIDTDHLFAVNVPENIEKPFRELRLDDLLIRGLATVHLQLNVLRMHRSPIGQRWERREFAVDLGALFFE
jgi:hypothetical protein